MAFPYSNRFGHLLWLYAVVTACGRYEPPPPHVAFEGLPASGSLSDARFAGFTSCVEGATALRCRKNGVRLLGQAPFNAAVDLAKLDGSGGFDQLTLWHDKDQYAVLAIGEALERQGWTSCSTGNDSRGDQTIYTRRGAPVKFSMDISYWGKRRFRMMPIWNKKEPAC